MTARAGFIMLENLGMLLFGITQQNGQFCSQLHCTEALLCLWCSQGNHEKVGPGCAPLSLFLLFSAMKRDYKILN